MFNYYRFELTRCHLILTAERAGFSDDDLKLDTIRIPLAKSGLVTSAIDVEIEGSGLDDWRVSVRQTGHSAHHHLALSGYLNLAHLTHNATLSIVDKNTKQCIDQSYLTPTV